tara:strand:- start:228 stop:515 length:288 start_codon:yes stop_codon:yes gene_type:complete
MFNYLTEPTKQKKTKYTKMNTKTKVKYSLSKGKTKKMFQPGGREKANRWGSSYIKTFDCDEEKIKDSDGIVISITPQKIPSNDDWYLRMHLISNE